MSNRWSYGPEGLRERPGKRRSEAELLPTWRDLQPLLIRSAGVVGIVATILVVVSSDALRFAAEEPVIGGSIVPAEPAVVSTQIAAGTSPADDPASPAPPAAVASGAGDVLAMEAETTPIVATESLPAATSASPVTTAVPAAEPTVVADIWTRAPDPAASPSPPLTTASVLAAAPDAASEATSADETDPEAGPDLAESPDTNIPAAPAGIDASFTRATPDVPPIYPVPENFALATMEPVASSAADFGEPAQEPSQAWQDGSSTCPRDWVDPAAPSGQSAAAGDCAPTEELIASVADGQSALEAAAAVHAETVAALMPRVPMPRPEVVPEVKRAPVRTRNRNSSWPSGPPPKCTAGQHAKWRFTDRKAGTKEWYCR